MLWVESFLEQVLVALCLVDRVVVWAVILRMEVRKHFFSTYFFHPSLLDLAPRNTIVKNTMGLPIYRANLKIFISIKLLFSLTCNLLLLSAGASNCRAGMIGAAGIKCGQPPCIPDPAFYNAPVVPTPTDPYEMCNSISGVISFDQSVCCSQSCGTCGGEGCDIRNGGNAGYECCFIVICMVTLI